MKRINRFYKSIFVRIKLASKVLFRRRSTLTVTLLERTVPFSRRFGFDRGKPVDRYYIEKFLYQNRQDFKGRILEVAKDLYATRYACLNEAGLEDTMVETLHYNGTEDAVTIIGDLTNPESLPENRYDCFVCTQTYNFIYDVPKALEGSYHLLKDGGVLLATVAGISQICRDDMNRWGDYWRFTNKSVEFLFKETKFSHVEIVPMGNVMAACAFLQGIALQELPKKELMDVMDEDYQLIIGIRAVK
jgi:SAM-dependent methyltransferase